jgi:hypothetical protein
MEEEMTKSSQPLALGVALAAIWLSPSIAALNCDKIENTKRRLACKAGVFVGAEEAYDAGKGYVKKQWKMRNCRTVCYDNGNNANSTASRCEKVC